ncbi:RNA polymerase sigma factor [Zafaria sp. Z1313]|uniref:RNA polymerase sigma factor n=1 Tax=Zafaria sp. Z1313 TaxID=3423202 RepID=UPI003D302CFD
MDTTETTEQDHPPRATAPPGGTGGTGGPGGQHGLDGRYGPQGPDDPVAPDSPDATVATFATVATVVEGFNASYRANYWLVVAFAERRLDDPDAARDAAAEAFRIAGDRWQDPEPPGLGFLYATCRNLIGNEYRRRLRSKALARRLAAEPEAVEPGPEEALDAHFLREALLELRGPDREVLYLSYWEEPSAARIAAVLGCSESAVWARISRARRALTSTLRSKGLHHG